MGAGQDHVSTKYFGELFTKSSMTFLSFVCGAGLFNQYGWWITDSYFNFGAYFVTCPPKPIQYYFSKTHGVGN